MNMESSVGLHCDFFDSNKSILRYRDDSLSGGFKYLNLPDEPGHNTNLFQSDNTVNFADI